MANVGVRYQTTVTSFALTTTALWAREGPDDTVVNHASLVCGTAE
jgi:hypothetical protein